MRQFIVEAHVKKGHLQLHDVPFPDETELKVIVVPKVNLAKMSFAAMRKLTKPIRARLSEDVRTERDQR